jgi:ankyrin repeat protein
VNRTKILVQYVSENCTGDDTSRRTPLILATQLEHVEVLRVLLEGGANTEGANVDQRTALHSAAWLGYLDVCRLLLDWGANVDPVDKGKNTPLHDAAWMGHLSVVKLLVERGADVRVKNNSGETASDLARSWGKEAVADWLDSVIRG